MIIVALSYLTKKPLPCPALHFSQKYDTTDAIFGKGSQKSRGSIIFSDATTIFQKVSFAYRKMMQNLLPVASKELYVVLEMVTNVKKKEPAKKSAAMKIVAEKERSDKILERYATCNAMRKRKRSEELENLAPEIIAINNWKEKPQRLRGRCL